LIEAITIDARRHTTRIAIEMIQERGMPGYRRWIDSPPGETSAATRCRDFI
jgi:hypothetical protein